MKFSFIEYRKIWFIFSGVLVGASILCLLFFGLRFSIDFTGGSLLELRFSQRPSVESLRSHLQELGYPNVSLQTSGETDVFFRMENLEENQHQTLLGELENQYGEIDELRFDSIGPVMGTELQKKSFFAVLILLFFIGVYVTWAFRKVSEPVASWKYGTLTLLAALHDILIPLGVFSLFGRLWGWEVGATFIAAILTILGYSINDTIVVFDRTRENLLQKSGQPFETVVEKSLHQTLRRSLNTSNTTLLALVAIYIWGGVTTQSFALALIVGIAAGTYSSIFLASPLLVVWEKWNKRTQ